MKPNLTPRAYSILLEVLGAAVVSLGVSLIFLPAGLVVAGVALVAFGLLVIDVDEKPKR